LIRNKIYPKKSLGQHYLTNEKICSEIVDSFKLNGEDHVIEIGPGQGAITGFILEKTKNLSVIEIDKNNCEILKAKFPNLNIINEDILNYSFDSGSKITRKKLRIIGNIPYNITTEIIFRLIDFRKSILDAQLMVQEEVALRLAGKPNSKEYGIPSVFIQVFSEPELRFKVSSSSFYPKPKVDSRIIYFDFTKNIEINIKDIEFFKKFVKTAFGQRRKTMRNSLKKLDLDLGKAEFDFSRRAETVSVNEFIELSNRFC
jgi:16S rRNA (adenine1518-N6/adenine1519-N6)-dimethyltransferase